MKRIGAHVSTEGGVAQAPYRASEIGATAFALFLKNQRRWEAPAYSSSEIEEFRENLNRSGIEPEFILPHGSYLINIGNPDDEARNKSLRALIDEIGRADQLGLKLLNIHPGSHLGVLSEEACLERIADSLNRAIAQTEHVVIVLENTAGQGTNLGYRFEQLAFILQHVDNKERVGVCIDTCHAFAAGYDLRTEEAYQTTMMEFERVIGFSYLRGVHLNDSMMEFSAKKDRHECLGKGSIGLDAFRFLMRDKRFDLVPLILETREPARWKDEIQMLHCFE